MPIDMTPEAIERRLRLVSEARRLGLSLRDAGLKIRDASTPQGDEEEGARRVDQPVPGDAPSER